MLSVAGTVSCHTLAAYLPAAAVTPEAGAMAQRATQAASLFGMKVAVALVVLVMELRLGLPREAVTTPAPTTLSMPCHALMWHIHKETHSAHCPSVPAQVSCRPRRSHSECVYERCPDLARKAQHHMQRDISHTRVFARCARGVLAGRPSRPGMTSCVPGSALL